LSYLEMKESMPARKTTTKARRRGQHGEASTARRPSVRADHDRHVPKRSRRRRGEEARPAVDARARATERHAEVDSLQLFFNEAARYPLLTAAEEVELAKRIERGDRAAKERMINSNLRLVIHNARRYTGHGVSLGDLVQEGIIGLNRAVEKFDWRKGYKFSTYATWWIRQACQRAVANQSKTIRIPVHVQERRIKLNRASAELQAKLGREATAEELAQATRLKLEHVEEAIFEGRSREVVRDISDVKQEIINFRKIVRPQRAVFSDLERTKQRYLAGELDIYFDDINDASERIWQMLEGYKETVEALEDTNESVLSHRLNDVLRVLTAFSVVLLPLTLMASIWGMNVRVPGEQSIGAFWIIIGVMVALLAGMLGFFRRRGWL
jgi:RNA polymerase sigma factor (sigma-70 family)